MPTSNQSLSASQTLGAARFSLLVFTWKCNLLGYAMLGLGQAFYALGLTRLVFSNK